MDWNFKCKIHYTRLQFSNIQNVHDTQNWKIQIITVKFLMERLGLLTLSAPNDVDLRFTVFLLWAKRRRSTSKYLNFPPYDVIGIKLTSMISATNTAVR
jgi:hypothetical protein